MLLVPVLFFVLLEVGLRLVGFGGSYPLFVEVQGHPEYLHQNPEVARRYFLHSEVLPAAQSDPFRKDKPEGTYRIFVQGGSTAAGFPYFRSGSPSRMLQQPRRSRWSTRPCRR